MTGCRRQPGREGHRGSGPERVHAIEGADARAGGNTAILLDTQRASARDNRVIIPIVLIVVLLILGLLLRSILAPVLLVATVVLSFGAALGISALAFRYAARVRGSRSVTAAVRLRVPGCPGHRLQHLPDDPGARGGEAARHPAGRADRRRRDRRRDHLGRAGAGRDVRGARHMPLVAFAEIGIAVAIGVLLDTIIVRSVLVTALNLDIGRHMWWPSRLAAATASPCSARPNASSRRWSMTPESEEPWPVAHGSSDVRGGSAFARRQLEVGPDRAPDGLRALAGVEGLDHRPAVQVGEHLGLRPGPRVRRAQVLVHPGPELRQPHLVIVNWSGRWPQPPCCCAPLLGAAGRPC